MEYVLMLGNGFDLYYKLPTKYCNFLQIVEFLSDSDINKYATVGSILDAYTAAHHDDYILACYTAHRELFDTTAVPADEIGELRNLAKDNLWFRYLLNSFNKDVGWIDFEKEISNVVHALQSLLSDLKLTNFWFPTPVDNPFQLHVIQALPFFYRRSHSVTSRDGYLVQPNYTLEYPTGSGQYIADSAKMISHLASELYQLSKALSLYLSIFAESIIPSQLADTHFEATLPFHGINSVITFNYTHTYERIYSNRAYHLHGSTDSRIVLGINPDKYDDAENADTLCIAFKKYYQRVMYGTDSNYLSWINRADLSFELMVMGHSLDTTDADIIKELFSKALIITIIYHDDSAKSSYISNIIRMFGKSGFDRLRRDQNLCFMHINSDFSEIIETRAKHSFDNLLKQMEPSH